jgi:transposase
MKNVTEIFVGVDVSKDTLAVHILPLEESLVFENNAKGIRDLLASFASQTVKQVVCEGSGGYESLMTKILKKEGFKVWCVEPKRIKHFIRGQGIRSKTDKMDARMIAIFASLMTNKHKQQFEHNPELRRLVARKKALANMIAQEKNRLAHPDENCKKEIKQHISFMQKQIVALDKELKKIIEKDEVLKKKAKTLTSVKGIGNTIATVLIAELPELGNISDKEIASLVGVAPYASESGLYKGKSVTSGGRDAPRSALFMAALVAVKWNAKFKKIYDQFIKKGKPKMVALVAIMRRLLVIINAMIKNETPWDEQLA